MYVTAFPSSAGAGETAGEVPGGEIKSDHILHLSQGIYWDSAYLGC